MAGLDLQYCDPISGRRYEELLLSCLLQDPSLWEEAQTRPVTGWDFADGRGQTVFQAMLSIKDRGELPNIGSIDKELATQKQLEKVGGIDYLLDLERAVVSPSQFTAYVDKLKENSRIRSREMLLQQAREHIYDESFPEFLDEGLARLETNQSLEEVKPFSIDRTIERAKQGDLSPIATGYPELDDKVKIVPTDLVLITARSRHGKSDFAYNLTLNLLEAYPTGSVVFLSHENPLEKVAGRMATIIAHKDFGVSHEYIPKVLAHYQDDGFPGEIKQAFDKFRQYEEKGRLFLEHSDGWTVEEVITYCRKVLHKTGNLRAVFIDYIELLGVGSAKDRDLATEERRISYIVQKLNLASKKILKVPIFTLVQTGRAYRTRDPEARETPTLDRLRWSDKQANLADKVLALKNLAVIKSEGSEGAGTDSSTNLEIIAQKNRGGRTNDKITVGFYMESGWIGQEPVGELDKYYAE